MNTKRMFHKLMNGLGEAFNMQYSGHKTPRRWVLGGIEKSLHGSDYHTMITIPRHEATTWSKNQAVSSFIANTKRGKLNCL